MAIKINIKRNLKFEAINLEKIIKFLVLLSVLLLPLFIGFGGVTILELNKQLLLTILVYSTFLVWIISQILKEEFIWRPNPLTFLGFIFLTTVLISSIFSFWQWGSLWGWPLDASFNFLLVSCFFLFYFIIANNFRTAKKVFSLQILLMVSGFLAAAFGILQVFNKFILPWNFTKIASFNTIGTVNSWAVFLGALTGPLLGLIFASKGFVKKLLLVIGLFMFAGLIIVNYWVAWIGVLIATSIFLIFGLWKIKEVNARFLIIPAILFCLAFIFGVFRFSMPNLISMPLEISPSLKASFDVSKNMLQTSPKDLVLGWGPGTFKYGWSKFKNPILNKTVFWNIRLSKGASEILETLGTIGILGTAFYILIIVFAIYRSAKQLLILQKEKKSLKNLVFLGAFCGLVSVSITKFIYPAGISLGLLWWLFLGCLTALTPSKEKPFKLKPDSKEGFLFSFLTILFSITIIFLFYTQGTRYLAEIKYAQILRSSNQPAQTVEKNLLSAIRLNPQQEIFFRDLAQVYLARANQEVNRTDIANEEKIDRIAFFVKNATASAAKTTDINPENVSNWQTRGMVYKNLIGLSGNAAEWAINSYEKALELEPANPYIFLEMGRVYLAQASLPDNPDKNVLLTKAENILKQAIELKPDYAPAFYQTALVYNAQGKRQEAISTLESLKEITNFLSIPGYDPTKDVGLAFQLGILYYQAENNEKAQAEFERAISLNPDYANARFFLAMVYDRLGQLNKAIEQLKIIEKSNPENEIVQKAMTNLRAGRPALEKVTETPEVLPIEEKPEEK